MKFGTYWSSMVLWTCSHKAYSAFGLLLPRISKHSVVGTEHKHKGIDEMNCYRDCNADFIGDLYP